MPRSLVRVDGEWRIRPRKAAIPGVRLTQMRQAFLALDDSEIMKVARIVLGYKVKPVEVHILRDRVLTYLEGRAGV
jgi:hypothetical protein